MEARTTERKRAAVGREPLERAAKFENESSHNQETQHERCEQTMENSAMAVKPLEDRVLVKPTEKAEKTESGIYLPESSKERPVLGKVVATGPGKKLENGQTAKLQIRKGDTVVYGKYSGSEIEVKGIEHLILRESEILGILQD